LTVPPSSAVHTIVRKNGTLLYALYARWRCACRFSSNGQEYLVVRILGHENTSLVLLQRRCCTATWLRDGFHLYERNGL